jgi:nitrite reductase/ring-hydroxylating ferredoxin subunit
MSEQVWHQLDGITCATDKFPARARIAGEGVLVFRTKTGYRGVERACPHLKATLMDAKLMANDAVLRCITHNFTFKLSDGKCINMPNYRVRVFEIKVDNGSFYGRWIDEVASSKADEVRRSF